MMEMFPSIVLVMLEPSERWQPRVRHSRPCGANFVRVYLALLLVAMAGDRQSDRGPGGYPPPDPAPDRGTAGTNLWPFQAAEGVAGPVAMGLMLTILWNMVDFVRYPGPVTAILIPIMFAAWLPAEATLWFFGALLVGLHRLGRMSLRLIPFEEDRSLVLRPLGSAAFTSFVVLTAAVLSLLATQWRRPSGRGHKPAVLPGVCGPLLRLPARPPPADGQDQGCRSGADPPPLRGGLPTDPGPAVPGECDGTVGPLDRSRGDRTPSRDHPGMASR